MHVQPFRQLTPTSAIGDPILPGWLPLQERPLCILVGVTGAGKSTLVQELLARRPAFQLLPDRRTLTDDLIIAHMQREDGESVTPVRDRSLRFAYTRRYRERFPGGMAHALSHLRVVDRPADGPADGPEQPLQNEPDGQTEPVSWLFDGLRGVNEVTHAAQLLPRARFAVLDAPDWVRVHRLLGRQDAFDQISTRAGDGVSAAALPTKLEDLGLADAANIFSPDELARLLEAVAAHAVSLDDLRARLQIVLEERRNYDPAATRDVLAAQFARRTLILNTVAYPPHVLAEQLLAWLGFATQRPTDHASEETPDPSH